LNPLPQFEKQPKEYNLVSSRRESLLPKRPRNVFVFSEKDLPGYKKRRIGPRGEEDSNYHGRSYLYENNKRDSKRKQSKKRFEPYTRRPIPKQTAVAGIVNREFECAPVENEEYWELERCKAETMLKPKDEVDTSFDKLKDATYLAPGTIGVYGKGPTAKVSLLVLPKFANALTCPRKNGRDVRLQRRAVLLVFLRTSLSTYYLTCFSITGTGDLGNSKRKPINQMPICGKFSPRSPRCGKVVI